MFKIEGSHDRERESTVNVLCYLQHKGWNYFQEEGPNDKKMNSREFDFKYFFKKNMKILIKPLTVSIYPKIT